MAGLSCGFCFKGQDEVALLIAGPDRRCICDDCVRLCVNIVFDKAKGENIVRLPETAPKSEGGAE